ncbi:MAG: transporter permease [Candidatus Angelobacter sp.]|jgi:putative ABC transport system permease protein|nr:transporter permease [Candidatus Angelobacter sp.]
MVDLAFKSLLHDKLKFAITVAGVAFAVMLVFVQVGLFMGLMDNATITIQNISADLWVTSKNTPNIDFSHAFPQAYVERVRTIPGVERADNLIIWFSQLSLPSGAQEGTEIYALEDFSKWNLPWNIQSGDVEQLRRGRYIMMDNSAIKRYGKFEVGEYREINESRFKIIGRTRDARSFTTTPLTFMDYRLVQGLNQQQLTNRTTYILVKVASGADINTVQKEIQRRLPFNDVYTKQQWANKSRSYWIVNTGLGLNMAVTVFLGCLVGIVIVAQTLYSSTMEHLKEFGTVKAIGGSNADIYSILTKQASIAAIAGYVVGAGMAYGLRPAMAKVDLKLMISNELSVMVFVGALVLCLGAAMISFRKVASIDPALVFRT